MMYDIVKRLIRSGHTVSAMESCTGGLFASTITDVSGASEILRGAFVTYCNEAKILQGVPREIIDTFGVYSAPTAEAMAQACMSAYNAEIGVGITGSLGRVDPNNSDSVVGRVYCCVRFQNVSHNIMLTIPPEIETRFEMKRFIVESVLKTIDELI